MTYQPIIPSGGNVGWLFLKRTRETQQAVFNASAEMSQDTTYFKEKIGGIRTAEDLVSDRRLLRVALGAFGLEDDLRNRFFVRKVLEEGTLDDTSFANRLADKRYLSLSKSFAFDLSPPNTVRSDFGDRIADQFLARQFEIAIGDQDENLRLALGLERELAAVAEKRLPEEASWFLVMGNPPVRTVFEKALGLPSGFGAIDVDKQVEVLRDKTKRLFGASNPAEFSEPELREGLVRRFLIRAELAATSAATARGAVALSLLQAQAAPS